MSVDKYFLDTNVLVYAFDLKVPEKAKRADDLIYTALATGRGIISYQVAQEFVAVARKPFRVSMNSDEIEQYWEKTLRPLLQVHSSPSLFQRALEVCRAAQISWYDALIVAAASQARCTILYSEDLQDGQRFGDLTIRNPFLQPV
jgi:predicted nucleic acid-binding protein